MRLLFTVEAFVGIVISAAGGIVGVLGKPARWPAIGAEIGCAILIAASLPAFEIESAAIVSRACLAWAYLGYCTGWLLRRFRAWSGA